MCLKLGFQLMQCQMRGLVDSLLNEIPVRFQNALSVATHLARLDRTAHSVALRPFNGGRNCNPKTSRDRPAALASFNRKYDALAQALGEGCCHSSFSPG